MQMCEWRFESLQCDAELPVEQVVHILKDRAFEFQVKQSKNNCFDFKLIK